MKFIRVALFSFLISALTFMPIFLMPADAKASANANNASGTGTVGSGTFILYPAKLVGDTPAGAITLLSKSTDQFFFLRNTGTINIAKFTLTITATKSFTLSRCNLNVLFTAPQTCASGSLSTVTIVSGVVTLVFPANSWYQIDFAPSSTTQPTISVSVSSTQIRSPIITNS